MLRLRINDDIFLNEDFLKDSESLLEEAFLEEMRASWEDEKEPVKGKPWAERKDPVGSWKILDKTGKLQETAQIFFNGKKGFSARIQHYGVYLQGKRRMFGVNDQLIDKFENILCQKILLPKRKL